jgi:hypothetical protein
MLAALSLATIVAVLKAGWLRHRQQDASPLPTPAPATQPRTIDLLASLRAADPEALPEGAMLTADGLDLDAPTSGDDQTVVVILAADVPAGDYNLKLTLTRVDRKANGLDIALARRNPNAAFCWTIGGFDDSKAGFWRVDGEDLTDGNPTVVRRNEGGWLGIGIRHVVEIRVRANSVTAALDGATVYSHTTDYSDVRFPGSFDLPSALKGRLGLRVLASHFVIHDAQVVEWPEAARGDKR